MEQREIKFRIWNIPNQIYVMGNVPIESIKSFISSEHIYEQYTGFDDTDDVKIYEGDIIETTLMGDWMDPVEETMQFYVRWDYYHGRWGLFHENNNLDYGMDLSHYIHDNVVRRIKSSRL